MRDAFGLVGLAVAAVVCCAGLPLILAAGLSAAALAWGGAGVAGLLFIAMTGVLVVRHRSRSAACRTPPPERAGDTVSKHREEVVQR